MKRESIDKNAISFLFISKSYVVIKLLQEAIRPNPSFICSKFRKCQSTSLIWVVDQDQLNQYAAYEGYVVRVPHNPHCAGLFKVKIPKLDVYQNLVYWIYLPKLYIQ